MHPRLCRLAKRLQVEPETTNTLPPVLARFESDIHHDTMTTDPSRPPRHTGVVNEYDELLFAPILPQSTSQTSQQSTSNADLYTAPPSCFDNERMIDRKDVSKAQHEASLWSSAMDEKQALDLAERGALLPNSTTTSSQPAQEGGGPINYVRRAVKRDLASKHPWTRFWICYTPFLILLWWAWTLDSGDQPMTTGSSLVPPSSSSPWSFVSPTIPFSPSQLSLIDRCNSLPPLDSNTYPSRLHALSSALRDHGGDGGDQDVWLAEPGASAAYYTDIGAGNWSLSERTFLVVVKAAPSDANANDDTSSARLSILTPRFELDRAKLLHVPGLQKDSITYVDWAEDASPFEALLDHLDLIDAEADPRPSSRPSSSLSTSSTSSGARVSPRRSRIHLDPAVRTFIGSGIRKALTARGYTDEQVVVDVATRNVLAIREQKSEQEIELLRCANELTLEAIRATKDSMHFGISESETRPILERNLAAFGLKNGGGLILFGENAALPHGSGTDRKLGKNDFVLIDAGGSFRSYVSDITRTFALPKSKISKKQARVWDMVREAQQAALDAGKEGTRASDVDAAARGVIASRGKTQAEREGLTHRLGHGIGLEGHESPYLVGSNPESIERGNVFSDEPGVYVLGEYGVRLEDCWFVNERGQGELFTGPAESFWEI